MPSKKDLEDKISYLEKIVSLAPGHIYWKDMNGVYLGCNNQQAKTLGFSSYKDIIGKTDYDLPWSAEAANLIAIDKKIMRTREPYVVEEQVTLPDGNMAIFLSHKVPLPDSEGNVVGVLGVSVNVTEEKKLKHSLQVAKAKAETMSRLKTEFMQNMQHDIRTPLSGIYGLAQKLECENLNSHLMEDIVDIKSCAEELLNYCDEILDFSKIEENKIPIVSKKFNLAALINKVVILNQAAAQKKLLNIIFENNENIPPMVLGDSFRVYRVILNLLSNAVKFTKRGYIKIVLDLVAQTQTHIDIQITIEDTGVGIPVDKQPYIYDKFFRVEKSNKGRNKGLGLGLNVVKQFMDDLGGQIILESQVGKGTTFKCIIPFQLEV